MLVLDSEECRLDVPERLSQALAHQTLVDDAFEKLPSSHKKERINWIMSTEKTKTRLHRIEKTTALLARGKNLRDLSRQR